MLEAILIWVCLLIVLISSTCLFAVDNKYASAIGGILSAFSMIACISSIILVPEWIGARHKAELLNKAYDTQYTPEQVFFASDIIEEVRQVQRHRYEINGDLFKKDK